MGDEETQRKSAPIVYGYGFSYAYLREHALQHPFPDVSLSEDYIFIVKLQNTLGRERVGLLRDKWGICLHVKHGGNTSGVDEHRDVPDCEAQGLALWDNEIHDPRI